MGKVKKQKHKKRSTLIEDKVEEEMPVDSKENAIQTIIDQLQAANMEEKYCGLQTFALLIENPENIDEILSRGVVRVAAPLILDSAMTVRNAAAGVLRNLSICGQDMCDALMEQDVMTPLTSYFHQFAETWIPDIKSKNKEDDETIINCINLLWNLCESSELAVKYMEQSRILDILSRYLDLTTFGSDIVAAVLQCLLVVVEDNPEAIHKVKANCEERLQQLLSIESNDSDKLLLKTLAAGVTINLSGSVTALSLLVINRLITILAESLTIDHRQMCNSLSSAVPLQDVNGKTPLPKGKEGQQLENQLKSVHLMLEAQQRAVEIVANLCSCTDSDESMDDSSDSEDMAEEEICNGNSELNGSLLAEDKLPPEIIEGIVSMGIFDKVWAKTQLPADNVMLILKEFDGSQSIYKKLYNLQSSALLCINNMISSLPLENLGGVNGIYKIWTDAGKLVFKQNNENVNLSESATAVMRAALDKIKSINVLDKIKENKELFSGLTVNDIEMMLTGIRNCDVAEIRSNLIRMIGTLALLFVTPSILNTATVHIVRQITEFLLEQAHKEQSVWLLAEIIDTLVDLYSEDETDSLAAQVKLIEKLTAIAPILKNKARQQRKLPQEYKSLVSTATTNLPRFISYKKDRISKL